MKKALSHRQRLGATAVPWHPLTRCRRTSRPSASMVRMRGMAPIDDPPLSLSVGFRLTHALQTRAVRGGEPAGACRRTDASSARVGLEPGQRVDVGSVDLDL